MRRGGPLQRKTPLRAKPPDPEVRYAKQREQADRARKRQAEGARQAQAQGTSSPRQALRTTPPQARRTTPRRPKRATSEQPDPVTPATRAAVAVRSGGRCEARVAERCRGLGQHVHHRKLRRHGDHRPVNLLHVCLACHAHIHSSPFAREAYARRFLLRSHMDPEAEPVRAAA